MKFIIVDDEQLVREGLKTLIDWSEVGFTLCDEASDGSEAVTKILEHDPELVIMDIKMPELSGIEVMKEVRRKGYQGKIIILSGYSDFTYAKNAIHLGVDSYLLKPIDEEELVESLKKIREKIEQENILELYNTQKICDTKNMLLKHILTGSVHYSCEDLKNYGLALSNPPFRLVIIDYSSYKEIELINLCEYWKQIYPDCQSEFIIIEKVILIIIKGQLSIQYFLHHVSDYIEKLIKEKSQSPFVVISDTVNEISMFSEIYRELKRIARRKFFYYEEYKPFFFKNMSDKDVATQSDTINPIEFIENIYRAILDNDTSSIDLTIEKLYRVLQLRDFTIEQTYQVLINCALQLKTLLNETYIEEIMDFNDLELIREICNCEYLSQIINLLKERLIVFCNTINKSYKEDIIEKVLIYINIHYNEDLKLEKIADLFGYNSAYLGRLLAERIGTNFNLYIEKKRLDKAVDMLLNTNIKIPDISIRIGYQNVEYFYRKFKKYTNCTPGNFRARFVRDRNIM